MAARFCKLLPKASDASIQFMNNFKLDNRLAQDTLKVSDFNLCEVRLYKCTDVVWLVLVPKREGIIEVTDLTVPEQNLLWQEILRATRVLQTYFEHDKINIATLGNVVPQLHTHIIARTKTDPHWPAPVWGKSLGCEQQKLQQWQQKLASALN